MSIPKPELFVEKLEQFIEAIIDVKNIDHIEDTIYLNQIREEFISLIRNEK